MSHQILKATALVLAFALAPAAHAETPSRDTGVGKELAAQGNQALRTIRAEMIAALRAMKPAVPRGRVVRVSTPPAGPAVGLTATVALAK
jgi:hypothetical protein